MRSFNAVTIESPAVGKLTTTIGTHRVPVNCNMERFGSCLSETPVQIYKC